MRAHGPSSLERTSKPADPTPARVPLTLAGRIITGVWVLVALITLSSLTTGIATAVTLQGIKRTANHLH